MRCDTYLNYVRESSPETLLVVFCLVCMVSICVFSFYSRKVVINYRNALDLYQVFTSEFKETPRTKVAKKYLKDDPILEDDDEELVSDAIQSRATMQMMMVDGTRVSMGLERMRSIKSSMQIYKQRSLRIHEMQENALGRKSTAANHQALSPKFSRT